MHPAASSLSAVRKLFVCNSVIKTPSFFHRLNRKETLSYTAEKDIFLLKMLFKGFPKQNISMNNYKIKPDIREQVINKGLNFPSDEELVMLVLGSGTKNIPIEALSKKVLNVLDGTNDENRVTALMKIKGMGTGKALAIAAALELGRRRTGYLQAVIQHPKDVIPYIKHFSITSREHFICITLNGAHEIIQIRVISVGTVNRTMIHPREIFTEALVEHAAAIIVCHNHPSGNCEPSPDDIKTTGTLIKAADILGVPLLDHIIINKQTYFSFLENKILF
jgi:DNA repair protein RadC